MQLLSAILNSLFPPRCLVCENYLKQQEEALCENCRSTISFSNTLFCGTCRARLPLGKKICHRDTPYLLGSIAPYEQTTIKKLILSLKFRQMELLGSFLGGLLADYARNINPPLEILRSPEALVIPIPLSPKRLRERGFNQAVSIARPFAQKLNLPIAENILIRARHTPPQSQSENSQARIENVRDVFSVLSPEVVKNKHIILIDDVTTTGATLRSASLTLKGSGAKEILALTIAH
jgi:ComF family protein